VTRDSSTVLVDRSDLSSPFPCENEKQTSSSRGGGVARVSVSVDHVRCASRVEFHASIILHYDQHRMLLFLHSPLHSSSDCAKTANEEGGFRRRRQEG